MVKLANTSTLTQQERNLAVGQVNVSIRGSYFFKISPDILYELALNLHATSVHAEKGRLHIGCEFIPHLVQLFIHHIPHHPDVPTCCGYPCEDERAPMYGCSGKNQPNLLVISQNDRSDNHHDLPFTKKNLTTVRCLILSNTKTIHACPRALKPGLDARRAWSASNPIDEWMAE